MDSPSTNVLCRDAKNSVRGERRIVDVRLGRYQVDKQKERQVPTRSGETAAEIEHLEALERAHVTISLMEQASEPFGPPLKAVDLYVMPDTPTSSSTIEACRTHPAVHGDIVKTWPVSESSISRNSSSSS